MKININVKKTFKINGKEYHSLDEMPGDIRELFNKAQQPQISSEVHAQSSPLRSKIIFNGTEYESIEAMPSDIRNLYDKVMKTAATGGSTADVDATAIRRAIMGDRAAQDTSEPMHRHQAPIIESAFSGKRLVVSGLVLALIALLYFLLR
jgi:hypothetical protein